MDPAIYLLPNNQIVHNYRGGDRIRLLRDGPEGPFRPEEWIVSTVPRFGTSSDGLSFLPDGHLLRDSILQDPQGWFGPEYVSRHSGSGLGLLIKLLDTGQRLPVHYHPGRSFAERYFGAECGKTEAWVVLHADDGAGVGLGFRQEMTSAELRNLVRGSDAAEIMATVNHLTVAAGDTVLIPAGAPHYLTAGLLMLELQEPADFSLFLEWEGLSLDSDKAYLGLGLDTALGALDMSSWTQERIDAHVTRPVGDATGGLAELLSRHADPFFRAYRISSSGSPVNVPAGLAFVLVLQGHGSIHATSMSPTMIKAGDALLLPWSVGDWEWIGAASGILCAPPI